MENFKKVIRAIIGILFLPLIMLGYVIAVIGAAIKIIGFGFQLDDDSIWEEVRSFPDIFGRWS